MSAEDIPVPNWKPAKLPDSRTLEGRFVRLEKLDAARHGDGLWAAFQGPGSDPKLWDYLWTGPFDTREKFDTWLRAHAATTDPWTYAVVDQNTGVIHGTLAFMSIVPMHGRIELGRVVFGASMQRTPKSTEAVYLLAKEAIALGYRRLEWSCNVRNVRSHRAALRFGFRFELVFRQYTVIKGRSVDVAWYSITAEEWPILQRAMEAWLSAENFDEAGCQVKTLEETLCHLMMLGVNV
ncbi:hypothetical protein BV898_19072 [Hypsibius exemplaris]|uniref:N-acetyltransferase domain-containing protein n=1 Tax=Hypsibius exemplaris TaxID=2072580 RepID=A0A9X6NKS9_HYPEX|nr:hypothetical protein BV898_19072 [Hypsibius exemplaris]